MQGAHCHRMPATRAQHSHGAAAQPQWQQRRPPRISTSSQLSSRHQPANSSFHSQPHTRYIPPRNDSCHPHPLSASDPLFGANPPLPAAQLSANTEQVYLAAFLELIPFPAKVQSEIIPVLPFWAIVSFGAYLLSSLGWGIFTFKDTEGAYRELLSVCGGYSHWSLPDC